MIERISPETLPRPSGFSHAVVASGRTVYLAGQVGLVEAGAAQNSAAAADGVVTEDSAAAADGVVAQFERALSNLLTALAAAGGTPADLAKITIYIVDVPDYRAHAAEIAAVWRRLCGREYPAASGIGVARLWDEAALVEIEAIAVLP